MSLMVSLLPRLSRCVFLSEVRKIVSLPPTSGEWLEPLLLLVESCCCCCAWNQMPQGPGGACRLRWLDDFFMLKICSLEHSARLLRFDCGADHCRAFRLSFSFTVHSD